MKKNIEINKESKLYKDCLERGKDWMRREEDCLKMGMLGYKKRIEGVGMWCIFKDGELWRDGFGSEVNAWRSLIGGIDLTVNMWDWGWKRRRELGCDIEDERIIEYMKELGEECGVKIKVDRMYRVFRVGIEKKDYLELRKEISKDLGWEIKYIS